MKIALGSDLHLEFGDLEVKNEHNADVLILSGDILTAQELHDFKANDAALPVSYTRHGKAERYREFLNKCSSEFPRVMYVAGNHEFYHGNYPDAYSILAEECTRFRNVYFLEQQLVFVEDFTFLGASLWTDMNKGDPTTINVCGMMMNDYKVIRNSKKNYSKLSVLDTVNRHKNTLKFFAEIIDNSPDVKYVVVGHHAPSKLSTKPQYEKDYHVNGAYSSDLTEFIEKHPQIVLWTHGHTHDAFDYVIGSTRIVCNPRGYIGYEETADNFKFKYLEI